MALDLSNLIPQFQAPAQMNNPGGAGDVSAGASIGGIPLGINAYGAGAVQQFQQQQNLQDIVQRNLQDNDLQYKNAENSYNNALKTNPLLDAQRQLASTQTGAQQTYMDNNKDLIQQGMVSDQSAKIAQNYATASKSKQQEMESHYDAALGAANLLTAGGYNSDPTKDTFDYKDQKSWDTIKKALDTGRVTGVGDTPNRADAQRIMAEGQAAINTKDQLQKLGLGDSNYVHQVGTSNAAKGVGEIDLHNQGVINGMIAQGQLMLGNKLATSPPAAQARYSVEQTIAQTKEVTPDLARTWISAQEQEALNGAGAATFKDDVAKQQAAIIATPSTPAEFAKIKAEAVARGVPGAQDATNILQLAGPLATERAKDALEAKQAQQFRDQFSSYPMRTAEGVKRLGDMSVSEILKAQSAQGAPGAAATQAVQRNPVNTGPGIGTPAVGGNPAPVVTPGAAAMPTQLGQQPTANPQSVYGDTAAHPAAQSPQAISAILRSSKQPYEPDKYDYRVAPDGSVQRKARAQ
jgi:hypothetical protein